MQCTGFTLKNRGLKSEYVLKLSCLCPRGAVSFSVFGYVVIVFVLFCLMKIFVNCFSLMSLDF